MSAPAIPFVDLVAGIAPVEHEYVAAFRALLRTGAFIGGAAVADFEAAFARHAGLAHAVAVKTGTDALLLALRASRNSTMNISWPRPRILSCRKSRTACGEFSASPCRISSPSARLAISSTAWSCAYLAGPMP